MAEELKPEPKIVVVQKIPEAPRKSLRFYPARYLQGAHIGPGCYWQRPRSGSGM